jgi:hypothetical protein
VGDDGGDEDSRVVDSDDDDFGVDADADGVRDRDRFRGNHTQETNV